MASGRSRTPLRARNSEYPPKPVKGASKKPKTLVPPMDRESLLELLRKINNFAIPNIRIQIMMNDLTHPTAERIELIYHMLLNILFGTTPDTYRQVPFASKPVEHPEFYDGFHYEINFLRALRYLFDSCVFPDNDFGPRDLTDPTPKRTHHFLSAIVNYIKFTKHMNAECKAEEYDMKMMENTKKRQEIVAKNSDLKQEIAALQRQKVEEKDLEEELIQKITAAEEGLKELQNHQEVLEKRRDNSLAVKIENEKKYAVVLEEFEQLQSRLEELKTQVVSSPEELKEKLDSVSQELNEMKAIDEETEQLYNMWEALVAKATPILPSIKSIIEDVETVIGKAEKKNELSIKLEKSEEDIVRIKQVLKETSAKQQSLARHLKLIQEEQADLSLEQKMKPSATTQEDELIKDVQILKKQLENKKLRDIEISEGIEKEQQNLQTCKKNYQEACDSFETQMMALTTAYEAHKVRIERIEGKLEEKTF